MKQSLSREANSCLALQEISCSVDNVTVCYHLQNKPQSVLVLNQIIQEKLTHYLPLRSILILWSRLRLGLLNVLLVLDFPINMLRAFWFYCMRLTYTVCLGITENGRLL
jgi:hypothetical protein